jgi:electron transfer flavoprotein alpha/beta subunit
MNEPDAYALEEALKLKEKNGGAVVVSVARGAVNALASLTPA